MTIRTVDEWVNYLSGHELPVLRATAEEWARLGVQPETVTPTSLAKVILHDPMLTLRVLQLANKPRHAHFGSEITTVQHAITLTGIPPLFRQFNNLSVIEDAFQNQPKVLEGALKVIMRAFHAAYQARDWAILRMDIEAEEVYVATFLHVLPELLLWLCAPDDALALARAKRHQPEQEAERAVLGVTLEDIRHELARAWHLPELTVSLMDATQDELPRHKLVHQALRIARLAERGWYDEGITTVIQNLAEFVKNTPDEMCAIVHVNAVVAARGWRRYNVPPAAAWLPMLPGEWPPEPVDAEPRADHLTAHPDRLEKIMADIAAHLDGSLNLHDMMALVLDGMHNGIGLDRVVFALMAPDRTTVRAKYVWGAAADSPLRGFQFSMAPPHLFSRLLDKVQSVWLHEANRAALSPLITPEMQRTTEGGDFFAMSLFVHGKAVGLFYADRKDNPEPLTDHDYQDFKRLCLRAAEGLAHLAKS